MNQTPLPVDAFAHQTAPRITPADLENNIKSEHFFTAANGVAGNIETDCSMAQFDNLKLLTFCVLVLQNDFKITGESSCVSPANFDAEKGRAAARENAVEKMWSLMGYALKEQIHQNAQTIARVRGEV